MYGYIYKVTNKVNGKLYIGQTKRSVEKRFNEHLHRAEYYCNKYGDKRYKYVHFYLAITKYGADKFAVETIDTAESKDALNKKEYYWINFYDSINSGYNMMHGGTNENPMNSAIVKAKHDDIMRSDEVRSKISASMSEYKKTYGCSDSHRKHLSDAQQNRKCFVRDGKITYASLNNTKKVEELLADGWLLYTECINRDKSLFARNVKKNIGNVDHASNEVTISKQLNRASDSSALNTSYLAEGLFHSMDDVDSALRLTAELEPPVRKTFNWANSPLIMVKDNKMFTRVHSENFERISSLEADGWVEYSLEKTKAAGFNPFATRSLACYCILDTGERFDFQSIWDAGKWWYANYKPFGEHYSSTTYQRKIEASIAGKEIVFGNKTHKCYKKITNISWYSNKD